MVTSPYEWKILELDEKPQTNGKKIYNFKFKTKQCFNRSVYFKEEKSPTVNSMSINQNYALSNVCLQANSTRGFSHNFHDVLSHRFSIILLEKGLMSSTVKPKINISSAPVFQSVVHRYRCREREVRFNPQQMDIPWNVKKHELRKMKECRTTSHFLWLNNTYKCYKIKALAMIWLLLGNRIWIHMSNWAFHFPSI